MRRLILAAAVVLSLAPLAALAQHHPGGGASSHDASAQSSQPATQPAGESKDNLSVTHHSITLDGKPLDYDATAGTLAMKDEAGKPLAQFFFVSYVKQPAESPATRPITFVFNGGPGAASVFLHLGAAGPKRIKLGADGTPGAPPHTLIDNDQTWLDATDLVFIDPVGTGFSRPAPGQEAKTFYGFDQDIESVGEFIRLYLTRYERWGSPKFLAGESYGTTRAAGLSSYLLSHSGIDLNGIILISVVLNFQTLSPGEANDLPYALYLPSFVSVALFHHKLQSPDEDALRQEAAQYAMGEYLAALAKGGTLTNNEQAGVVDHLARYTGLAPGLIDKANLRIDSWLFRKQLLNDQRLILGGYDARLTGEDAEPADQNEGYDPSASLYIPAYAGTFNDYVRRDLKFESDLPYEVLSGHVNGSWDYGRSGMGYLDVIHSLRQAMLENPHLHVLVASGYDDLVTPYLGTTYTFDHLDPTGKLRQRVTQTFYHSGHMIYHDPASLVQLKRDIAAFVAKATAK